jgi:uncharacterized protein (TIGR02145 family)
MGTATILGTTYQTVIIGGKEFAASNLMAYGTGPRYPADQVTSESSRALLDAYGALYLRSEVLALPLTDGWRLPTPTEWAGVLALVSSPLNLKLTATGDWWDPGTPWRSPNTDALGSLGMNMQAAGSYLAEYWQENVSQAGYIHLSDGSSYYLSYDGGYGPNVASLTRRMSVRLVRDTPIPDTPVISPSSRNSLEALQVSIACATEGASIYYTFGDPVSASWIEYTAPLMISSNTTINTQANLYGNLSLVATATYNFPVYQKKNSVLLYDFAFGVST